MARIDSGLDLDDFALGKNNPRLSGVPWDPMVPYDPTVYRASMVEPYNRVACGAGTLTTATQTMRLSYFVPRFSFLATKLGVCTAGTAAATVTLIRCGLYTVAANGDITLVASGTNDTSGNGATNTEYTQAITGPSSITSYQLRAGVRYAFAYLFVGTTAPVLVAPAAINAGLNGTQAGPSFCLAGTVGSQSDLPATTANGSITIAAQPIYFTCQ